jgi:hypothetical protein
MGRTVDEETSCMHASLTTERHKSYLLLGVGMTVLVFLIKYNVYNRCLNDKSWCW